MKVKADDGGRFRDMSVRDWFAGMALTRLDPDADEDIGTAAYDVADSLIRAGRLPPRARAPYTRKTT